MDHARQTYQGPQTPGKLEHHQPEAPVMDGRRRFLVWLTNGLGALFALVLAIPALAYLLDPRHRKGKDGDWHDITTINELPVGIPLEFVIREDTRDAWTYNPNQVVGRVFLIRQNNQNVVNDDTIKAFTTICPHLGCSVNFTGNNQPNEVSFRCPCHDGKFTMDGSRVTSSSYSNPAPRGMDQLEVRGKPGNPTLIQIKHQNFVQGIAEKKTVS